MDEIKIFGQPVNSYGVLPDDGKLPPPPTLAPGAQPPMKQTIFLSPRYEPSNISSGANILRVQNAIREAENGQTQELFRFYRDALLGDDHIQTCLSMRKLATLSQPLAILPENKNDPDDVTLAKGMLRAKNDCENWQAGMIALMDGVWWPNSIEERLFRPADEPKPGEPKLQYTLRKFVPVNPQLHCYQWAYLMGGVGLGTASAIQLSGFAGQPGASPTDMAGDVKDTTNNQYVINLERWEPYLKLWPIDMAGRIIYDTNRATYLDPGRHVVHRGHMLVTSRDNWGGPARATLAWWLLRGLGREWFSRGMERYGAPWPVAYTDANDPAAIKLIEDAFNLMKIIGGLIVDENSRIELKEAMAQGMAQGYQAFYDMCNEAISFQITGMKSSQKPGGLNAGEDNLSQGIREDIRVFDQMMLNETCKQQIAKPFRDINGLKGNVKFIWGGLSDTDAKTFADLLVSMSEAGFEPTDESIETINERTGMAWQRKVSGAGLNLPPADNDPAALSARGLKWLSATVPANSPVDSVAAEYIAALAKAFRGNLSPIRAIILNSASRADAEKQLKLFFADWSPDQVAGIVEEAMQVCAAKGAATHSN